MLSKIVSAAREAGRMMLEFRDSAIHQKEGHFNYVTDTDVAVQQFLQKELLSLLPGSRFLCRFPCHTLPARRETIRYEAPAVKSRLLKIRRKNGIMTLQKRQKAGRRTLR